jgi:hypothetical protein
MMQGRGVWLLYGLASALAGCAGEPLKSPPTAPVLAAPAAGSTATTLPRTTAQPASPALLHGHSDSFASHGVALWWAVLRGADEASTQVVWRLALAPEVFASFTADAVDPFSQQRRVIAGVQLVGAQAGQTQTAGGFQDIRTPRVSFADFPRTELHLRARADAPHASVTIYYLGVPDTAPEFASEAALQAYLNQRLAQYRAQPHGPSRAAADQNLSEQPSRANTFERPMITP